MSAAAKLEKAKAEHDRVVALLDELRSKRDALDIEADSYANAYEVLDSKIAIQERALVVCKNQVEQLKVRAEAEEAAAATARRATAIKAVEAMLPARLAIIKEIEQSIKLLPALFVRLDEWQRNFVKKYPAADVELPYAHWLDADRVLQQTLSAMRAIRIADAGENIDGLTEREAEQHAGLIDDLTQHPAPKEDIAA